MDPYLYITTFLLAAVAASGGLVAVWAGTSRVHWFWRALAMWTFVAAMVPIRAYEPAVVFAGTAVVVCTSFGLARWIHLRRQLNDVPRPGPFRQSWRFELRDVFLLMLIIGMWLAMLIRVFRQPLPINWLSVESSIAILSAFSLASHQIVVGKRRVLACFCLLGSIPIAEWLVVTVGDSRTWELVGVYFIGTAFSDYSIQIASVLVAIALSLVLTQIVFCLGCSMSAKPIVLRVIIGGLFVIAIPTGLVLARLYLGMLALTPVPPPFESDGNNYVRIRTLAEEVQKLNPSELALAAIAGNANTATAINERYAELFKLLEAGNYVPENPLQFSDPSKYNGMNMGEIQLWRSLARWIHAEGQSAATSGKFDRAAEFAVANLRLGTMLRRGGSTVEALVGCAIDGIAANQVNAIRDKIDNEPAQRLIAELRRSQEELEPIENQLAREQAVWERTGGWQARLQIVLADLQGESALVSPEKVYFMREAVNALLQTDLSLRLHAMNKGRFPETLSELVPDYLPELPKDVYSAQPLVYRATDKAFQLYSVGKNGRDDGGQFTDWVTHNTEDGYDLDLDTLTRR